MNEINLKRGLQNSVKFSRDYEILKMRVHGYRLKDIEKVFGITRERVRQLENRAKDQKIEYFENLYHDNVNNFKSIMYDNYIILDSLSNILDDYSIQLLFYSYKTINKKKKKTYAFAYSDILETLVLYDVEKMHSDIFDVVNNINISLKDDLIKYMQEELLNKGYKFRESEILTILKNYNYDVFGEFILPKNINISESIRNEVLHNYKDGINTSSEKDIDEFKDIIANKYLHKNITTNSIISRIQQSLYLWDKSTYIHEDLMYVDEDLMDDIIDYIHDMELDRVSYKKLYNLFKCELNKYLPNYHALHGYLIYLKDINDEDYICLKSYVCKPDVKDLSSKEYFKAVSDLLAKQNKALTSDEIVKAIPEFDKSLIRYTSLYYPEVIKERDNKYFNVKSIKISEEDKLIFEHNLQKLIDNKLHYTSRYILYDYYTKNHKDLLEKYNIINKRRLFHLHKELFNDDYLFCSPHIVLKDKYNKDKFVVSDLIKSILNVKQNIDKKEAELLAVNIYKGDMLL